MAIVSNLPMRIALIVLLSAALSVALAAQGATPKKAVTPNGGQAETPHLVVTTSANDRVVAPGTKLTLIVDVTPKKGMHVYAPGQAGYIPVSLKLEPDTLLTVALPRFPPAERFFFKALEETQLVYSKPFRILQDITIPASAGARGRARAAGATLTVKGTLKYQACDETICFRPVDVPISWTLSLHADPR